MNEMQDETTKIVYSKLRRASSKAFDPVAGMSDVSLFLHKNNNNPTYMMVWDTDTHHLEVEVFCDGKWEWFYCNRSSDDCIDGGDALGMHDDLPDQLVDLWRMICCDYEVNGPRKEPTVIL